jgi:predicted N-acetyltransferase YhbS
MEIELRLEKEEDYRAVEEITREAFWNLHFPGCDEHLLVRNLRRAKEFVPALDFVAISNNKIVGNIVYAEASVKSESGHSRTVLTFGPVSVLPEYQKKGIGSKLIRHTIPLAKEMGYNAIIIYGDPAYYERFGFRASKEFHITDKEKKYPAALLVLELSPNALHTEHSLGGVEGIFDEGAAYEVDKEEAEEFDKGFEKKEKLVTKSQEEFAKISNIYL